MEETHEHLHLKIPASLGKAIDDYWFSNRIRARSEAIRTLIKIGLQHSGALRDLQAAE